MTRNEENPKAEMLEARRPSELEMLLMAQVEAVSLHRNRAMTEAGIAQAELSVTKRKLEGAEGSIRSLKQHLEYFIAREKELEKLLAIARKPRVRAKTDAPSSTAPVTPGQ